MKTSIELLKARVTWLSMITTSPSWMGRSNDTLFTAAVTTTLRQWRLALTAAATSIQFKRLPPIKLPSVLVSLGNTMRTVELNVSWGWRASIMNQRSPTSTTAPCFFETTCLYLRTSTGTIAQLVEQRIENPCVPGSNPGSTTTNPRFGGGFLFAVVGLSEVQGHHGCGWLNNETTVPIYPRSGCNWHTLRHTSFQVVTRSL